jgi:hypothetical protein
VFDIPFDSYRASVKPNDWLDRTLLTRLQGFTRASLIKAADETPAAPEAATADAP